MNMWEIMISFLITLSNNRFINLVIIAVMLDTFLGLFRAIKERKFNSCFGIDGAIRKIAMVISVVILAIVDKLLGFNMLPFVSEDILKYIGITQMGICEFFCLLYILYEAVSILKNMCLCGLPIPKLQQCLEKFLRTMTGELDDKEIGGDDK
ncbi:MAG: phage holin family protein [Hominilimicola sp.]